MEGIKTLSDFQQRNIIRNEQICKEFQELVRLHGKIGSSWKYSKIIAEKMKMETMTVATVLKRAGLYYLVRKK